MRKKQIKSNVLVIAHDAGGAEIIAAYISVHPEKNFTCFAGGPALNIFRRERIACRVLGNTQHTIKRVIKTHADASMVLLGTGWMTRIEAWSLEAAKKEGMKTICYLESWVNYRERFGYPKKGWKKDLPDEIWVGDKYAQVIAEKYFSTHVKVRLVPNQYFKNLQSRAKVLRREFSHPEGVLFLSDAVPGVEQTLETLLIQLCKMKYPETVRIALHPADHRDRYGVLIEQYRERLHLVRSQKVDLVRNLLSARVVIGAETVALVVSVLLRKTTICITEKRKRTLPFPEIIYVKNAEHIDRLI